MNQYIILTLSQIGDINMPPQFWATHYALGNTLSSACRRVHNCSEHITLSISLSQSMPTTSSASKLIYHKGKHSPPSTLRALDFNIFTSPVAPVRECCQIGSHFKNRQQPHTHVSKISLCKPKVNLKIKIKRHDWLRGLLLCRASYI